MTRHISKKKTLLAFLIAVIVSLPLGWIVAMLLTPVLWRLEPILNLELAGHSGPSDWVFLGQVGFVATLTDGVTVFGGAVDGHSAEFLDHCRVEVLGRGTFSSLFFVTSLRQSRRTR